MLKTPFFLTALFSLTLSFTVAANEPLPPKQQLDAMVKAKNQLNYEIIFVQTTPSNIETLRYRHLSQDNKTYAQLATLDGVRQEIVQRDNLISYFKVNHQPFTINAQYMLDNLPSILHSDFNRLQKYYDFVNVGRNRIADRIVQTIRILPKDNFRYQYVVFIDEENHLLLRSDMLDRDDNLLEQFRVVDLYVGDGLQELSAYLRNVPFPPLLTEKTENTQQITAWNTSWLPEGFGQIKESVETEDNSDNLIESRLYSDGLFSFTLYVSDKILPNEQENVWKQGANTIYSENIGDKEVTLIGQIPVSTAKRIVQDIQFKK